MELFSIQCTTCGTRLKVRNLAAIGQILSCPKCQSFVEVKAPPGWTPPAPEPAAAPATSADPAAPAPAAAGTPGEQPAGFQRPFGFEHAERPAWHYWAGGAVAVLVVIALATTLWPSGDPVVAQGDPVDPPAVEQPAETKVEAPPVVDPPVVDPEKKTPDAEPKKVDPPKLDPGKPEEKPNLPAVEPTKGDPTKLDVTKVDPTKKAVPNPVGPPAEPVKPVVEPVKPIIEPIKPARPDPAPNPGLPQAEVESRLATAIESIQSPPKLMLSDAIDALAQISNLKIMLDIESLTQAGVSAEDQVAFDMSKCTVADVLDRVLEQRGLVYLIEAGQLRVASRKEERDVVRERAHEIGDLTKGDAGAARQLAAIIQATVEPASWQERPIVVTPNQLVVNQSEWVHRRLSTLLGKLRIARGLTPHTPAAVDQALASRVSRASTRLSKPLTVNIAETPLTRAVVSLSVRSDSKILVDSLALDAAGISPESKVTVQTKQAQPFEQILLAMLTPLELSFRVIDEKTLQVTTRQAAAETIDLELYRARDLATSPALAMALIERIEREVAPGTWYIPAVPAAPGAPPPGEARAKAVGGIAFDPISGFLIVSHMQAVQANVDDLLDTIRRPAQPAPEPEKK